MEPQERASNPFYEAVHRAADANIGPAARCLYLIMAAHVRSAPTERAPAYVCWLGIDELARLMGYATETPDERANSRRKVRFLRAQLVEEGLMAKIGGGHAGRQAEYLLTLMLPPKAISSLWKAKEPTAPKPSQEPGLRLVKGGN